MLRKKTGKVTENGKNQQKQLENARKSDKIRLLQNSERSRRAGPKRRERAKPVPEARQKTMSSMRYHKQFIQTREAIYREAEEIAKIQGIPALVDTLLFWADDAFHNEVFKDMADAAAEARCSITGVKS